MVLQKRLDYGFNGYQVPPVPRATRSARRRRCFKKGSEDNQVCPFDLLALVAGNLLLEKDSNPSSGNISANEDQFAFASDNVQNRWQDEGKPGKVEAHDHENPARNFFVSKHVSQVHVQNSSSKENDMNLGLASPITNSNCMERVNVEKLVNSRRKDDMGPPNSNVEVALSSYMECCDCKLKDQTTRLIKDELHGPAKVLNNSESVMCSSDDPEVCNRKPAPVSLHSSAKGPLHGNNLIPNTSCPVIQDNVNVVSRDDDENSSGCTHTSTTKKFLRSAPRIRDRRIRKILASKYWKVAPKLKDATLSKIDGDWRSAYCNWKNSYKYQGSEKLYPLKKRKHFGGYNSPSNSDGGISSESFSGSLRQCNSGDASGSFQKMHRATGPSVVGQNTPFQPRDSHVKLRIKSFRVPELFIEIPESGTIGSLKRAVMETVTAVLGGGLRVGVLLQGKKVRDDNKTLLQTGISHHNQLDALGFSLEPNHPKPSASLHPGDSLFLLPCEAPQPLSRCSPTTVAGHPGTCATSAEPHAANSGNLVQSNHDSAPSPTDISVDNSTTNSKALVTVPAMNVEALAVAPAHQKHKRSEIAQRRIRRPFSVAEVEALVQAVEKLGTGRWRDVKLQAFDDAKHRTYVDLKDKWKTLVHTARISPQQRRGEPVPQELLDRVLTAHAYWSQQQAKHQLKRQLPETCLLL